MYLRRHTISILTTTGGADTEYTPAVNGIVHAIEYERDGTSPLDSTGTITITGEVTTQAILTQSFSTADWLKCPRSRKVITSTGGVINPSSAGSANSNTPIGIPIVDERIKAIAAAGGASKVGTLYVYVDGGA